MKVDENYTVELRTDESRPEQSEPLFIHVDDVEIENVSTLKNLYVYGFAGEESENKVLKVVDELKKEYILASGVVFPNWMKEEIDDLTNAVLESAVWLCQVNEYRRQNRLTREKLQNIKEYHND